jgi:hypothetical protein
MRRKKAALQASLRGGFESLDRLVADDIKSH